MSNEFFQLVLSGIAIGCVYGLVALGFVLIYKATGVVNFAQGELMMFGADYLFDETTRNGAVTARVFRVENGLWTRQSGLLETH